MKMNTKNVYQRIHAVMTEIGTIAKNGTNTFHKYKYASEADYVQALRPLLSKHGLVVIPNIYSEGLQINGDITTAVVQFNIVNVDDPKDFVQTSVLGQGQDKGDKGVYKLMTGAKKYFAALTFMVATGDDPEKDDKPRGFPKKAVRPAPPVDDSEDF
jgi:hypothetical protein